MPLLLLPTLLAPIVVLVVAAVNLRSNPGVWILVAGIAAVYLAIIISYLLRRSTALDPSKPASQRESDVTEAVADYFLARIGLTLVVAVVAMVAIIVWGLAQPR